MTETACCVRCGVRRMAVPVHSGSLNYLCVVLPRCGLLSPLLRLLFCIDWDAQQAMWKLSSIDGVCSDDCRHGDWRIIVIYIYFYIGLENHQIHPNKGSNNNDQLTILLFRHESSPQSCIHLSIPSEDEGSTSSFEPVDHPIQ